MPFFHQMKFVAAPTANCTTLSSSSPARRMPLTTTLVATTPSAKRSSILCLTARGNWPTIALVFRDSLYSTPSVVVLDLASLLC